jgi:hypothetical protein
MVEDVRLSPTEGRTNSSFCIVYSTIGVDRNRLNSNGRSILRCARAGCANSTAAARSPSMLLRGPVLAPALGVISVSSSSLPSSTTMNDEWGGELKEAR